MIKYLKFFFVTILIINCSCSKWNKEKDNFVNTYKDIYVVRIKYTDSAKAEQEVDKIYKKYGYTKVTFKEAAMNYMQNKEEYSILLDSAIARATREQTNIQLKELQDRLKNE